MKPLALLLILLPTSNVFPQTSTTLPDLIVPANTTREISAQRWEFGRVDIGEGATLQVTPGGQGYLHLVVRGPMVLKGTITAQGFSSNERTLNLVVPGVSPLRLSYTNSNRGGRGGRGGFYGVGVVSGGAGAPGTVEAGGGGGGAGGWANYHGGGSYNGNNAQDEVGGSPQPCGPAGGNGGFRAEEANGGAVFLEIHGDFDGGGGTITVNGTGGHPGNAGANRSWPSSGSRGCYSGAGAGGGGGPGGQGGYIVVYVAGKVTQYPTVSVEGGSGGQGGAPGYQTDGRATKGADGQPGRSGEVYWYPVQNQPPSRPTRRRTRA
jgi:hypothetical protein